MKRVLIAMSLSIICASTAAHAFMLRAVVKDKDGTPKITSYGFGSDEQACIAAMEAIKKMQPEAVIVQPCTPETPPAVAQPLFHSTLHDCDGDDFSGHLPKGFVCRGSGTGVGFCLKPGDRRVIGYDVQGGPVDPPSGYCHLDWVAVNESKLKQYRQYLKCKGSTPECATAAFGKNPQ